MPYWDFEGKRLTEVDTEFPNVNGLYKGKQYDLLLYDDRFVCGCMVQQSGLSPLLMQA